MYNILIMNLHSVLLTLKDSEQSEHYRNEKKREKKME